MHRHLFHTWDDPCIKPVPLVSMWTIYYAYWFYDNSHLARGTVEFTLLYKWIIYSYIYTSYIYTCLFILSVLDALFCFFMVSCVRPSPPPMFMILCLFCTCLTQVRRIFDLTPPTLFLFCTLTRAYTNGVFLGGEWLASQTIVWVFFLNGGGGQSPLPHPRFYTWASQIHSKTCLWHLVIGLLN